MKTSFKSSSRSCREPSRPPPSRIGDLASIAGNERGPDVEGRLQSGPKKLMHRHRIQPLLIARVEEVK
jgi:hypothetical protein